MERGELDRSIKGGDDAHRHRHVVHRLGSTPEGRRAELAREGLWVGREARVRRDRTDGRDGRDCRDDGARLPEHPRNSERDDRTDRGGHRGERSKVEHPVEGHVELGQLDGTVEIPLIERVRGPVSVAPELGEPARLRRLPCPHQALVPQRRPETFLRGLPSAPEAGLTVTYPPRVHRPHSGRKPARPTVPIAVRHSHRLREPVRPFLDEPDPAQTVLDEGRVP